MRLTVAVAVLCTFLAHHALAQNVLMPNNPSQPAAATDKSRTVSMTLQMSMPAPEAASSTAMTNAMEATDQALYDIINHECQILTEALKGACRLSRVSIGSNFNEPGARPFPFPNRGISGPSVSGNVNATFEVDLPPAATANSPAPPAAAKP